MTRLGTLLRAGAAVTAAVTAAGTLLLAQPASGAAGGAHARYVPIAGNGQYLVYAEAVRAHTIGPLDFGSDVRLYALAKSGRPTLLGRAGPAPRVISLSRSMLIVATMQGKHRHLRWWDLATGRHSDLVISEDIVGASPDGWLFEVDKPDGTHVYSQSPGGDLVDYGIPMSPHVDYAVTSGPNGFVAYADNFQNDNGEITYTSWAHRTRHRTLLTPGGTNNKCESVTSRFAACVLQGAPGRPVALFPLDGRTPTIKASLCPYAATVWGTRLAWVPRDSGACAAKHVGVMSRGGTIKRTVDTFNRLAVTSAFGRLVLASPGQRALETLKAPRGKTHLLARATI
jgi:hypothetical protein